MAPQPEHYGACQRCTAKWFSRRKLAACPRYGSSDVLNDIAAPPWRIHPVAESDQAPQQGSHHSPVGDTHR